MGWEDGSSPQLALPFAGSKTLTDLDLDRVRRLLVAARLEGVPAESIFLDGIQRALATWRHIAGDAPASMVTALRAHHAAVPLLRPLRDTSGA